MLTKLTPDQISKFWDLIKYAIEQSLPPTVGESPDKMQRILESALAGRVDVWAGYERKDGKAKMEGIVLTQFLFDTAARTKSLLIYCLYGYDFISNSTWQDSLVTLVKYASGKRCNQIVAYTDVDKIIEMVNKLGGETKYTFITFDVKKLMEKINV